MSHNPKPIERVDPFRYVWRDPHHATGLWFRGMYGWGIEMPDTVRFTAPELFRRGYSAEAAVWLCVEGFAGVALRARPRRPR